MSKAEKYIVKLKEGAGEAEQVIEKVRKRRLDELENTEAELEIEKMKMEIRKLQEEGKPVTQTIANDFAGMLFAGRRPEEVKQILDSLEPEHIQKLALITSSMGNNQLGLVTQLLSKPDRSMKDTLDLVTTIIKLNQPQQNTVDYKAIAEIFKAGVEAAKAQNQPMQQPQDPMQIYKVVTDLVRPYQQEAHEKEKEAQDLRMRELESRIVNPMDYIKNAKTIFTELGLTSGGKTEIDLKHEEMQQTERLENRKLDLEEKKYFHEKENEGKTVETVKDIIKTVSEGPIGKAIENIGGGAAERIRGGKGNNNVHLVRVQCPTCHGEFSVNPALPQVTCTHCGQLLGAHQPTPNPEPAHQPEPVPQPEPQPNPEPVPQPEPQPNPQSEHQPTSSETPPSPEANSQNRHDVVVTNIVDLNKR